MKAPLILLVVALSVLVLRFAGIYAIAQDYHGLGQGILLLGIIVPALLLYRFALRPASAMEGPSEGLSLAARREQTAEFPRAPINPPASRIVAGGTPTHG
jgi:hypothetical protein